MVKDAFVLLNKYLFFNIIFLTDTLDSEMNFNHIIQVSSRENSQRYWTAISRQVSLNSLHYYVEFRIDILGRGMNFFLSPPVKGEIVLLLMFYKDTFGIK